MRQESSKLTYLIPIGIAVGLLVLYLIPRGGDVLLVGCTTSLYDTGLLDMMFEELEENLDIRIKFISTGTGLALRNAARGNVDALLVHAPSAEEEFLRGGYGVNRKVIAYNFFLIVGPESDPAGIAGLAPEDAFVTLRERGLEGEALWISRGDGSGTNIKEIALWEKAGFEMDQIRRESWYLESGSGMANTLRLASEKEGYTLTDSGTHRKLMGTGMSQNEILVETGEDLLNVYSAILVNPMEHPNSNFKRAMEFLTWLISDEGQRFIANYGKGDEGEGLFLPIIGVDADSQTASRIRGYAFLEGSECPPRYRYQAQDLYEGGA